MSKYSFLGLILVVFLQGCQQTDKNNKVETVAQDPWLRTLDFSLEVGWEPNIISDVIQDRAYDEQSFDSLPYVILISIDGYRYDYSEKFGATTLESFDVKAEQMISSFPSKTFPNHFSIVTGSYPGRHGLISNTFYNSEKDRTYEISNREEVENGEWYKSSPIWWLAMNNWIKTSSMFWVGSEAIAPNMAYSYTSSIPNEARINKVIDWLGIKDKKERPKLITLYFEMIDDLGHDYGPDSKEVELGVQKIDSLIAYLQTEVNKTGLPVNIIVTSDHGMLSLDPEKMIDFGKYQHEDAVITTSFPIMIYSDNQEYLEDSYIELKGDNRLSVHWKDSLPESYHYQSPEVTGDLVIVPKPPYYPFIDEPTTSVASHGWDPAECPEMGAIFYATGPAFKKDQVIPPFENIHVYPLIAEILNLDYDSTKIDGRKEVLIDILAE